MLTARGDGVPAKSFTGSADQLGKLTTEANWMKSDGQLEVVPDFAEMCSVSSG